VFQTPFRHAAVLAAMPNYHARSIMHAHSLQHNLQGRNVGDEGQSTRHVAWVGLVPRQFSSGDRKVLMGISKRGNQHLRSLLVHGARAVARTAPRKTDLNNQWVNQLRERRGFNRATETTNTQRFEADSLADEPVLGEPVSGQIPCYQGKKQGISQNR
jgi:hypothetical protein